MYLTMSLLLIAAVDDLATRKIHNILLGGFSVLALAYIFFQSGPEGLLNSFFGLIAGFAFYLPLAWFGVIGGGDLKLLAVVGICAGITNTLLIGTMALAWGVVIGVIQIITKKELSSFFQNIKYMSHMISPEEKSLHRIPYALALFFAGATLFVAQKQGWQLW